jgi:protein-tyrosine phosphatase
VIDLHTHVLPGLDDGAADAEEAVAMCRAAAAEGIAALAATPHVREDYPTAPDRIAAGVLELRQAAGDVIRILPGAELALEELSRPAEELREFGLGGNPGYVLVETPYVGWPLDIRDRFSDLHAVSIVPVLAHPERNLDVQLRPTLLRPLVEDGALVQLTAASVDGRQGRAAEKCARELLDQRLAHLLASDAHRPSIRAIGLAAAVDALGDAALAQWLTSDVPTAIVERRAIPPRPRRTRRRWFSLPSRER